MIKNISLVGYGEWFRKLFLTSLIIYAGVLSAILVLNRPKTILVGIDNYGTRIIDKQDDRLLKLEKTNFIKKFIQTLYSYDQETFTDRVSRAGDLMSLPLWNRKADEYKQVGLKLKESNLEQESRVIDIREIDPNNYQADLELVINQKLKSTKIKLRVDIRIQDSIRRQTNPFPFEVSNYEEEQIF